MFKRYRTLIDDSDSYKEPKDQTPSILHEEFRVLLINGSSEMAKELSLQLTLNIPGCSIMYAPSIQLAKLILLKRKVELVVSSAVLPDGGLSVLSDTIRKIAGKTDLASTDFILVGEYNKTALQEFGMCFKSCLHLSNHLQNCDDNKYEVQSLIGNRFKKRWLSQESNRNKLAAIRDLSANIRNDLNNPLQEIVTMAYVAKYSSGSSTTDKALEAIAMAAKNMSKIVWNLEEKLATNLV